MILLSATLLYLKQCPLLAWRWPFTVETCSRNVYIISLYWYIVVHWRYIIHCTNLLIHNRMPSVKLKTFLITETLSSCIRDVYGWTINQIIKYLFQGLSSFSHQANANASSRLSQSCFLSNHFQFTRHITVRPFTQSELLTISWYRDSADGAGRSWVRTPLEGRRYSLQTCSEYS